MQGIRTRIRPLPICKRITDRDIIQISTLIGLVELDASGNSGITDVSKLVNLTALFVYGNNRIRGIRPNTTVYR